MKWIHVFSKRKGYIGLHITSDMLTAVQLIGKPSGNEYAIAGWSKVPLHRDTIVSGKLADSDALVEALRRFREKPDFGSFTNAPVIFSFPEHQCFHTTFQMKKAEVKSPRASALEKTTLSVPFAADDLFWDWTIVRQNQSFSSFYSIAIPRDVLMPYRAAFAKAQIDVKVVEPEILSSTRFYFRRSVFPEPVLYATIGREEVAVATLDENGIHQSSVIEDEGIDHWAGRIAADLGVKQEAAEKALFKAGVRPLSHPKAKPIQKCLSAAQKRILQEFVEHKEFYDQLAHEQKKQITRILLNGEGVFIPEFIQSLQKQSGMHLVQLTPWAKYKPELTLVQEGVMSQAFGAAIRGIYRENASKGINVLRSALPIEPV